MKFDISYGAYHVQFDGAVYSAQPNSNHEPEGFICLYSKDLITVIHAIDALHEDTDVEIPVWLQDWMYKPEDLPGDDPRNFIDLDTVFAPVENLPAAIANALDLTADDGDWPLSPERMSFSPVTEDRFQF